MAVKKYIFVNYDIIFTNGKIKIAQFLGSIIIQMILLVLKKAQRLSRSWSADNYAKLAKTLKESLGSSLMIICRVVLTGFAYGNI